MTDDGFDSTSRNAGLALSSQERLRWQQYRLVDWAERWQKPLSSTSEAENPETKSEVVQRWELTQGIALTEWQRRASNAWFAAGRRGTLKVVTGAGKTVVALAIAERLQREDPQLRVAIVVPTIVLMQQWFEALRSRSNLPDSMIGRLGGGYADDFNGSRRILIAVLASARKDLASLVRHAQVGDHVLFIADECHRVGAPEMSAVLQTPRRYSLGLSATPERDDRDEDSIDNGDYGTSRLGTDIGAIVYEMTFADATRLGVLPPFELQHFGLPLSAAEARRYEALSRSITEARRELMAFSPAARKTGGGDRLVAWARRVSARGSGRLGDLAARFMNDTTRRKQLVYRAESRLSATRALVREALEARTDARVILFHESIEEVVNIFGVLFRDGIPVVMEHSELPSDLRESSLDQFRTGTAKVIVSARSLIEGFNVPEADLGIIVASSSSPRQRIQSIGRVLRTYRSARGSEKVSRICVLYIRDSVDERIYEREDWDRLVGLDRNRYFKWDPPAEPIEQQGPPRAAVPTEDRIESDNLDPGDDYPGRYEGAEYSTDTQGNVSDADGRIAINPQGVPAIVAQLKGQAGRFRLTPKRNLILVRVPRDDESWVTVYAGELEAPFEFPPRTNNGVEVDISSLTPGDVYRGPLEPVLELRFRQRSGGVITKRVRNGELYARGPNADRLISAIRSVGQPVSKIYINELGHAFWRDQGIPRLIAPLDGSLDFPDED